MKCPSCNMKIGIIRNAKFMIRYALRKATPCPYCNINIYKQMNPTWEYLKLILYSMVLIGIIFFLLAIIFGQKIDLKSTLVICFWCWIIAVFVIFIIIFLNLVFIFFNKIYLKIIKNKGE